MLRATNCPRPVIGRAFFHPSTGEVRAIPCGSWSCHVCAPAKAHRLGLVAAAADPERFITLSRVGDSLQDALTRLRTLSRSLRRAGRGWEYLCVPESHKSAGWHLHLLQRGSFIPQRELSRRAASAGMGSVVWITAVREPAQVARYLVKYMVKSDAGDFPKGTRRYRTSRNFWPEGRAAAEARAFGSACAAAAGDRWGIMRIGEPVERT